MVEVIVGFPYHITSRQGICITHYLTTMVYTWIGTIDIKLNVNFLVIRLAIIRLCIIFQCLTDTIRPKLNARFPPSKQIQWVRVNICKPNSRSFLVERELSASIAVSVIIATNRIIVTAHDRSPLLVVPPNMVEYEQVILSKQANRFPTQALD